MNVRIYSVSKHFLTVLAVAAMLLSLIPFNNVSAQVEEPLVVEIPCGPGFAPGFVPNCVPLPPEPCPDGFIGVQPVCTPVPPPPVPCGPGFTGIEPNCVPVPPPQCVIYSDTNVAVDDGTAIGVTAHPAWVQDLPENLGEWIWTEPDADGIVTFTKVFNVDDAPTGAILTIAVDNGYSATLNGNPLTCDGSGTGNFNPADTCSAPVVEGVNTLVVSATNAGGPHNPDSGNPAGLNFELVIDGSSCSPVPVEPVEETIVACKYDEKENLIEGWTMYLENDEEGEDRVSEKATTNEDGCVSFEVNPADGPYFVSEEVKDGWQQLDVGAENGEAVDGEGGDYCVFMSDDNDDDNYEGEYRCNFMNGPAQCTNLLVNGSFEEPALEGDGWGIFSSVTGWVINLSDGLEIWRNFNGSGAGLASDGQQNVEMDGNDATKITQSVVTIPGALYELTFDFSPRAGTGLADNNVDAAADGVVLRNVTGDGVENGTNVWTNYANTFTAADAATDISFEDKGVAQENGGVGALIDNARLCLVREPEVEEEEPEDNGGGGNGKRVELDDEPEERVEGDSDSNKDAGPGRVLGEQTSVVPAGAPNTGAGGAGTVNLMAGLIVVATPRRSNLF